MLDPKARSKSVATRVLCAITFYALAGSAFAAIQVDGKIDHEEWGGATEFDDFRALQPLTLAAAAPAIAMQAKLLSTPEGLAVAISAKQPREMPRVKSRVRRDFEDQVDRVNFMIDFDADGRAGYVFTISAGNDIADQVITNEVQFNPDWDGAWQHAVAETESGYDYEMLIPWSITGMKSGTDGKRTVAVYFDRVIANTGQRFGTPEAAFTKPRFLSDFRKVEIASFAQSLLAITPYAVGLADLKNTDQRFKAGVDVFWKPNSDHQFALTLNPDFGQVESDQLVVNFDAVETFFTDKRPFFTENQAAFTGAYPGGNLFYTRRVGGSADDGSGASDINAAVKANGNFGDIGYAVFGASEDGSAGRDFLMARASHSSALGTFDASQIRVDRPFLDRTASVSALHGNFKPSPEWSIETAIHQSRIEQAGVRSTGLGGGVIADWDMPGPFRQQYFFSRVDANDDLNDLGFQDRNNFRYLEWETGYRQDDLAPASYFASHAWEFEVVDLANLDGFTVRRDVTIQRYSEARDGGNLFFFLRRRQPVFDDRIGRGNGVISVRGGWQAQLEQLRARQDGGRLSLFWSLGAFPGRSADRMNFNGTIEPRLFLSDRFDVSVSLFGQHWNDWLLWQGGREFGSFSANRLDLGSNLNWFISERQELRVKLEAIAIDAEALTPLRLVAGGGTALQPSTALLKDFRVRNLGFQVRYRYKLGNLSDVFVVYSRGGARFDNQQDDVFGALESAFELRDDDQFLVKLAYRFDL
jgi:hypothetical protein